MMAFCRPGRFGENGVLVQGLLIVSMVLEGLGDIAFKFWPRSWKVWENGILILAEVLESLGKMTFLAKVLQSVGEMGNGILILAKVLELEHFGEMAFLRISKVLKR